MSSAGESVLRQDDCQLVFVAVCCHNNLCNVKIRSTSLSFVFCFCQDAIEVDSVIGASLKY